MHPFWSVRQPRHAGKHDLNILYVQSLKRQSWGSIDFEARTRNGYAVPRRLMFRIRVGVNDQTIDDAGVNRSQGHNQEALDHHRIT